MGFIQGAPLFHMLNGVRIAWVMGLYGGGKTLGVYDLAYNLYLSGRYRYILGNSNSVWTDNPETVKLRDGSFVDGVVIMDEGGLFMALRRNAEAFMLGLRKLNITILVPSVLPPSSRLKSLTIQRVLNGMAFGVPIWLYNYRLSIGTEKEKAYVAIWKPQEIYGIYDTLDYPIDDLYLSEWLEYWMRIARDNRPKWADWGHPPGFSDSSEGRTRGEGQDSSMDNFGGDIEEIIEATGDISEAISILAFEGAKKGRKSRR